MNQRPDCGPHDPRQAQDGEERNQTGNNEEIKMVAMAFLCGGEVAAKSRRQGRAGGMHLQSHRAQTGAEVSKC